MVKTNKQTNSNGMSIKAVTALVIIIFLLGLGGTMWYYALYKISYTQFFDIKLETKEGKQLGFNVDPTLNFGHLPSMGGKVKKELNLINEKDIPLIVQIRIKGDATQFISVEENNFILQPGEVKQVNIYAIIPESFGEVGVYTGEAKITYMRP